MKNKCGAHRKALVWFRRDLRLNDNRCLQEALGLGMEIIPVFVWNPWEGGEWSIGEASRWWLHRALESLDKRIAEKGGELIFKMGPAESVIPQLAQELKVDNVFFSKAYEPVGMRTQDLVESKLQEKGIGFQSFNNSLLNEPWAILNGSGKAFQVFTPYWRKAKPEVRPRELTLEEKRLVFAKRGSNKLGLDQIGILPKSQWHEKLKTHWDVSESGARKLIDRIPREIVPGYSHRRNKPYIDGTSRLSPYLAWGLVSPRPLHSILGQVNEPETNRAGSKFLAEIGWREFSHQLLFHFPSSTDHPLREKYRRFPWRKNDDELRKWQRGQTGYPLVDAGMRQLWATGWMHNRVRMVVASFLVKHLLLPWQTGSKWFWQTLVDADLASNTQGWQWTAGCGADAAPYFRVFNPIGQGEKFDSSGAYVRKWVPELERLPAKWIHQPWNAPSGELDLAKVQLGKNYPLPMVEHREARHRALAALATLKR